jgi:cytoplasmic iron level regulating protein YaaA (DUF328/UPF0246 family)
MKHALISCVKTKLDRPARANELYISPLFQKSYAYAQAQQPDNIFILSAKHGLVEADEMIHPYDMTLNDMSSLERKAWSESVLDLLDRYTDITDDLFLILAGKKYREHLLPSLKHHEIPLEGLGLGEQLRWLSVHYTQHV